MNGSICCEFRPVLRRPRQEWIIPAIDTRSVQELNPADQANEPDWWEGTTGQGREILRKILFFIETRIECQEDTPQVIGQVEARLRGFAEIFPELLRIFLQLCGRGAAQAEGISIRDLATLMVIRVRLERARRQCV